VADTANTGSGSGWAGDRSRGLTSRVGAALAGLWLLTAALAARQTAAVLRLPPDQRLPDLDDWLGPNGVLHLRGSLYKTGTFIGTPFSGLVLKPLTRAAERGLGVVWTVGTLLLVIGVALIAARNLPRPVSRRTAMMAVPVAGILAVLSVPVRNNFYLGQISILPVLLVLLGQLTLGRHERWGGALTGLAAALQPAVLLFAPLMWMTGRRRAAASATATFAGCTLLACAAMPADSWTYWAHHFAGVGLGEPADSTANQSLHGALLRLGLQGPGEIALFAVLAAAVAALGLRRAVNYHQDGQPLLAVAVTGCVVIAVSPTAWQHEQLWILLALVGRTGRRTADRLAWPSFVVMVMSFGADALMPRIGPFALLGENAPLLAALLAACAVPFLSRTSPLWDRPVVAGLLSRPNLVLELLLIRVGYWIYSYIRSAVPNGRALAESHGRQIIGIERFLHINVEHWLNHKVAGVPWLVRGTSFYYETFHFAVPIAILAATYIRRPDVYRWGRAVLAFATLFALVGFWLYPLAPPRLMPGFGFVDTAHGPQDFSDPNYGVLTNISNQYAAMPSLHIGWSLWCAVMVARLTSRWWLRALGALYPLTTAFVILGSANHYVLDMAGGATVVLLAVAAQRAWRRCLPEAGRQPVPVPSPVQQRLTQV